MGGHKGIERPNASDCVSIDHNGAVVLAERIRAGLEGHKTIWNDEELGVTTSVGVAGRLSSHANVESLVSDADQALLQAKRDGRNRVVVSSIHA
jgi:two-component system cell cycle response regulator